MVLTHLAEIPSRLIQASSIRGGLDPAAALEAGMIESLPHDTDVKQGLRELVRASLG
jgi:hypothetical protein